MSSIAVSKVVKTTTDDKDSYDILLKGQMRLNASDPQDPKDVYSETVDVELILRGITQHELLVENGISEIGAVKEFDLNTIESPTQPMSWVEYMVEMEKA